MFRKVFIILLLAAFATTGIAKNRSKRNGEGTYNFTVGGYVHGTGTAKLVGDNLRLDASVTAESGGAARELNASSLTVRNGHFSGTGNLLGEQATFEGRIDAPDDDNEKAIRGVRLVCTVKTQSGHYAKLIGYIPALAQTKDRIDDEEEKGKGKKKK